MHIVSDSYGRTRDFSNLDVRLDLQKWTAGCFKILTSHFRAFDHICNHPRPSFSPVARYEIFSGLTRFPPYSGQERGERVPQMSAQQSLGLASRFQLPTR